MTKIWLEVEYRLIAFILFLIGSIPIGLRSAVGYRIGYLLAPLFRREFSVAKAQLARFLNDPTPEQTARKVFGHAGRLLLEGINIAPLLRTAEVTTSDDRLVDEAIKGDRGMVVLTAHLSSWDLLAAAMNRRGVKISTVAKRMRRSSLQRILEQFRRRVGVECLWREKRSDAAKIRRHLENCGVITALVDQDTEVRSEFVPLFGVPAAVPVSLLALGKKTNAQIVHALMVRTGPKSFYLHLQRYEDHEEIEVILEKFNLALEELIRSAPDQWVWFHKRWKTREGGKVIRSRDYVGWLDSLSNKQG